MTAINRARVLICLLLFKLQSTYALLDYGKFDEKMLALAKVLEFIKERPRQMNIDTTVGVTFAEVNLEASLRNSNVILLEPDQRDLLEIMLILSQSARNGIHASEHFSSDADMRLSAGLNRPSIWQRPISWKKLPIDRKFTPNSNLTVSDAVVSLFDGRPGAAESDRCLLDLIDRCGLSDECRKLVVSDNSSSTTGYPLTHRLLIKQTNSALKCNTSISRFSPYLGYNLCYLILHDLMTLENMGFPDISKDLALEQIFLCGMEGYLDFLTEHYEKLVLDWQHISGCYRGFGRSRIRRKRAGNFTDFRCINHTTGLAAAALALMIRKDIETTMVP